MSIIRTLILLLAFIFVLSAQGNQYVKTSLISEVASINPGEKFLIGVHFEIENEWHIYWKNPGDAGLETKINLTLPQGFTASEINWPYPEIVMMSGLVDYGYENETLLFFEITPPVNISDTKTFKISAETKYLVCKVECLPGESRDSLSLPVNNGFTDLNKNNLKLFDDYAAKIPIDTVCSIFSSDGNDFMLQIPLSDFSKKSKLRYFPSAPGFIKNTAEQKYSIENGKIIFRLPKDEYLLEDPDTLNGVLQITTDINSVLFNRGFEIIATSEAEHISADSQKEITGILTALIFAFIGGIILNLMPCVLPVLSIKILGFLNQKEKKRNEIILHGWLYTAGVVFSFLFLAGLLILLRFTGEQIGWGFQLQSPGFLIVVIILIFIFALNLFGVFETGNSAVKLGGRLELAQNKSGSFFSGVAATLLATPCTAPFMGSAIGFAIVQPPIVNLSIFLFLGLGMALPYLLISYFPGWLKYLPKPGAWMNHLKEFLGFLLLATVIWLMWVLSIQQDSTFIIIVLISLLLSGIAAWIYGLWGGIFVSSFKRTVAIICILIFFSAAFYLPFSQISETQQPAEKKVNENNLWEDYSQEKVDKYIAGGESIFIDFTAAWCLTCQVNKKTSLETEEIEQLFKEKNIKPVVADWTSRSEEITKALASYGRNSVPLYVLYSDGKKEPFILPEILTKEIIKDYIKIAFSNKREEI